MFRWRGKFVSMFITHEKQKASHYSSKNCDSEPINGDTDLCLLPQTQLPSINKGKLVYSTE